MLNKALIMLIKDKGLGRYRLIPALCQQQEIYANLDGFSKKKDFPLIII